MAHHQHHDDSRRPSAIQNLLKMLHLTSNSPTIMQLGEEELAVEAADEPPDDTLPPLPIISQSSRENKYPKETARPAMDRRESLLTRAIRGNSNPPAYSPTSPISNMRRPFSTTSSHSTASTAELTSDDNLTSPPQSATPSPPPPTSLAPMATQEKPIPHPRVVAAPPTESAPTNLDTGEAAVEKTLGRKRCIMFACGGGQTTEKRPESEPAPPSKPVEQPKRKCMLTFACPSRNDKKGDLVTEILDRSGSDTQDRKSSTDSAMSGPEAHETQRATTKSTSEEQNKTSKPETPKLPQGFHEFASSNDEHDAWVDKPIDQKKKLTLQDCLRKESAFRQLGEEAEEEAEEEEDQEGVGDNEEDVNEEDDFAPSDESADDGNESDDEEGFADSDDESDEGSDGLFWTRSTTTAATSATNLTHISSRQRSPASSLESSSHLSRQQTQDSRRSAGRRRPKVPKMRPGTPELPDSTDFVCGTLDEDRPLEAAYIACREQKKREKHVPIPQDIDPSFPTTDPEDNDDNEEEADSSYEDELQLSGIDDGNKYRGRGRLAAIKVSSPRSPKHLSPSPQPRQIKQDSNKRTNFRSPPPPKHNARGARSPPPPRRLFGHSPTRLRSPPPHVRLRSPRASPTDRAVPFGITINRLGQRPSMGRTSSLPHTPNPFFRDYQLKSAQSSVLVPAGVDLDGEAETFKPDMHVRGPVDIVAGLEKKRQKRRDKFWRQHCRKAAKEAAERKPVPGRGAERMKELGLECAERARQYAVQPGQLVISL